MTDQLLRNFHIRALQARDNRSAEIHALDDGYEPLCDGVTTYNSTEDVDENGCDFGVAGDEVEGLLDG